MSKTRSAAAAAVMFVSALAASAAARAQSAPEPAAQPAAAPTHVSNSRDPNQVICKREEVLGSRLGGHKECHTRADWEQMQRDAQEATTLMQSKSGQGVPGH